MIRWVGVLVEIAAGLLAGHVAHELAHLTVLRVAGWNAELMVTWPLRVQWTTPVPVPPAARVAAVAPAIVGAAMVIVTVASYQVVPAVLPFCVGAIISLCMLSPADRDIALGQIEPL